MTQELRLVKITKNCFSTFSSRLIFALIATNDFCTRGELVKWTGFSNLTITRYLQEFGKEGLIANAPGIVFISDFGEEAFNSLVDFFKLEIDIAKKIS